MLFTIFFYVFLASGLLSAIVFYLAWRHKNVSAAKELGYLMIFVGLYDIILAFEAASVTLGDKIVYSKMAYMCAAVVPVLYFLFIMRYTGYDKILSWQAKHALFFVPFVTQMLTLTNESHHLIWKGFSSLSPETNLIKYYHGTWFWFGYQLYSYILLLIATILLSVFVLRHRKIFRSQCWFVLFAGFCPWLAAVVYLVNLNPIAGFDISPLTTGLCGLLMIFVIVKSSLLDLAPIAREKLMETLRDGILALDSRNRVQDINRAACSYLGIPNRSKIGFSIYSCGVTSTEMLEAIVSPEPVDQLEVPGEDGTRVYSISKRKIAKESGSRLVLIRDITEQISIQREIQVGEERYRNMYGLFRLMSDNMSDMLWAKDLDKKFIFVNKAICDNLLKARDTEEPIGKTDLYFWERIKSIDPEDSSWKSFGETCQLTDDKVLQSGMPEHFEESGIVDCKPLYLDVKKAPIFDKSGSMIGVVGSARNVTRQKKVEQEILDRDKLLTAISKATTLLLQEENIDQSLHESFRILGEAAGINRIYVFRCYISVETGKPVLKPIHAWSDDFAEGLGVNRNFGEDFLNQFLPDWYGRLSKGDVIVGKVCDFIRSERLLLESQKIKSVLIAPVFIDKEFWGSIGFDDCKTEREWSATEEKLLHTAAGTIASAYVRKKNQDELLVAKERAEESNRLKTAFLSNLSHEIRTPMNSILGFASLLQDPALTRAEKREYIQIVREGSERLLNTIQDIIDISRIEARQMSLNLSDVNINEMVATLHSLYIREAENKFLDLRSPVLLPLDQGRIRTDKYKIYSILSNLINNAIKYTKTGYVEIVLERSPSTLRFNIRDTGIGIPLAKQNTIFDSFVQADASNTRLYEGSGLGLTITKAYVEMLGGKIWFESKENAGSSFFFEIPIQESESIDGGT